jgi:fumarylacetoacetase
MSLMPVVEIALNSDFSIQNLPYGVFSTKADSRQRVGTRLGDWAVDLSILDDEKYLDKQYQFFADSNLNGFMSAGRDVWQGIREQLTHILSDEGTPLKKDSLKSRVLIPMEEVKMHLPAAIGDYTDFYASREHATNVGIMFRGKENALMPNWLHLPVGYHGRASSIVVSGTEIRRPRGQVAALGTPPVFAATRSLDFELEMGFFIGIGNPLGESIAVDHAIDHIFGMVLLNDWSARDIQAWEYQPLGPFLAKNFATSISPWVVTMDALEPFRVAGPKQEPKPLSYLQTNSPYGFDIRLEVSLQSQVMDQPVKISNSNMNHLYWSIVQQLTHHTEGGCNMRTGDLCGTGTISGPAEDSYGSMLELTWRGEKPIKFFNGETREYLQDGDTVVMRGYCQGDGYRVGFGEVSGKILPVVS